MFEALLLFGFILRFTISSWDVLVLAWVVCSRKEDTCHYSFLFVGSCGMKVISHRCTKARRVAFRIARDVFSLGDCPVLPVGGDMLAL